MDLATLIPIVLQASIALTVFCLGLETTHRDALYLLGRPSELLRSVVSMSVVMPVVALALVLIFDFHVTVDAALLTLSVSPLPPLFPRKSLKAGGKLSYTIGLLVAVSVLSIITIPIAVELIGRVIGKDTQMSPLATAKIVLATVLLPLGAGILVRSIVPAIAESIAKPLTRVATIALIVSVVPLLIVAWPAVTSLIGNGTVLALAAFVVIGLGVGHLLGGPDPDDRSVLALSTATRHPGMAIAIANANNPGNKLLLGAIVLYLIVNAIIGLPYVRWSRKRREQVAGTVGI